MTCRNCYKILGNSLKRVSEKETQFPKTNQSASNENWTAVRKSCRVIRNDEWIL